MSDLISRLESGEGLDRDLDELIWAISEPGHKITRASTPKYTESLDAAVALVEKMLPEVDGWQFTIYHDGAQVSHSKDHRSLGVFWGRSNSRPRALCAALLRALSTATRNPEKE